VIPVIRPRVPADSVSVVPMLPFAAGYFSEIRAPCRSYAESTFQRDAPDDSPKPSSSGRPRLSYL
jgi:hypothetical protein